MAEDIELDDFDLDDDLDFDLDLGLDDAPPKITHGRDAVIETATIAGKEAASKLLGKGKERELILSSLPTEYSSAADSYDKLASVGGDIVEAARKDLRTTGVALKRAGRQAAPLLKKYLPARIASKLDSMLEDNDTDTGSWNQEEDPNELAIQKGLENLAAIEITKVAREEEGEVRNELKDQIKSIRSENSNKLLGIIAENTSNTFQSINTVTNAYQRKMIELNFRQFFAQRDLLELSKNHFSKFNLDLSAVVKNTALPDYAKEQFGEITRALMKRETVKKILPGQFNSEFLSTLGGNVSRTITEAAQGFRDTATELGDGLEQLSAMEDTSEFTEEELAAKKRTDAAKLFGGQMAAKYAVPLRDKLLKSLRNAGTENETVSNFGKKVSYELGTLPELINAAASGEETGTILDKFSSLLESVAPKLDQSAVGVEVDTFESLGAAASWGKRENKTLNIVIPALLNDIITSVRQGNGDDTPGKVFDYNTGMWVTQEEVSDNVSTIIGNEGEKKARREYLAKLAAEIDVGNELDDDELQELMEHIDERARTSKRFDMGNILKDNSRLSYGITEKLADQYGNKTDVININEKVRSGVNSIRSSFSDSEDDLDNIVSRYGASAIADTGALSKTKYGYELNQDITDTFSDYKPNTVEDTVMGIGAFTSSVNASKRANKSNAHNMVPDIPANKGDVIISGKLLDKFTDKWPSGADALRVVMSSELLNAETSTGHVVGDTNVEEDTEDAKREKAVAFNMDTYFEKLGELYDKNNTPEARKLAMKPIIDLVTATLAEHSAKPEAASILAVLQELSINGVGKSDTSKPGASAKAKSKLFGRLSGLLKSSKGYITNLFSGVTNVRGIISKQITRVRDAAKTIMGKGSSISKTIKNTVKKLWGEADIYSGDGKLFLSGKIIKAGGYFDAAGKQINSIKDIKGAIYDAGGNVLFTDEDVSSKIGNLSYSVGGKLERIVGGATSIAIDSAVKVKKMVMNTSRLAIDGVKKVHRAIKAQDVYIKGDKDPILTANLMAKGHYLSKTTGKTILTPLDIDGVVIDSDGNELITAKMLADPSMLLVDSKGKSFRGKIQKIKDAYAATVKLTLAAGKYAIAKGKSSGGNIRKAGVSIKDKMFNKFGFGKDGKKDGEVAGDTVGGQTGGKPTDEWLSKIYTLLDDRLDKGSAEARSKLKADSKDALDNARPAFTDASSYLKRTADGIDESVKNAALYRKEDMSNMAKAAGAKLKDAKLKASEKASAATASAKEKTREASKIARDKIIADRSKYKSGLGDSDGDGIRDGSYKDRLNKFKLRGGSKKPKEKVKKDEKSSGFNKLLSMLGGMILPIGAMLKTMMGGLIGGVTSMFTGLLAKVGIIKGVSTAASAASAATAAGTASKVSKTAKVLRVATTVGRGLLTAGGWLLRGLSMMTPVGIGLMVASAVAYGVYRLATRTEHFDRLRYALYGTDNYTHGKGDDVAKIVYLEEAMSKYLSFRDGISSIKGIGAAELVDIAKGMDVDTTDEETYRAWQLWFKDRFLPIYLLWTTRSHQVFPDKVMRDISSTEDYRGQLKVVKSTALNYEHGLYKISVTPFDDTVDMDDLMELRVDVTNYLEGEAKDQKKPKAKLDTVNSGTKEASKAISKMPNKAINNSVSSNTMEDTGSRFSIPGTKEGILRPPTAVNNDSFTMAEDKARNISSVNILESIRFNAYGLIGSSYDKVHTLFKLEAITYKHLDVSITSAKLTIGDDDIFEYICSDFGLSINNPQHKARWIGWFRNRFLPVLSNLCMATMQYAKGNNPLTLGISKSNSHLGKIARSLIMAKSPLDRSVWELTQSPWADSVPLSHSPVVVMARVNALVKLVTPADITEDKISTEVKLAKYKVAVNTQTNSKPKPSTQRTPLARINIKQTESVSDVANAMPSSTAITTEVESDDSAYGKLSKYGTSRTEIGSMLTEAAGYTGIDAGTLATVAMMESSMDASASAYPTSSAKGLYQFINDTWKSMIGKHATKYGIPANTSALDPAASALMGAEYLKGSQSAAAKVTKATPTVTDIYMGHFLGHGGMRKFFRGMQKDPNRIAAFDFKNQARANPRIFIRNGRPLSYKEVYTLMGRKTRSNATYAAKYVKSAGVTGLPLQRAIETKTMQASSEVPDVDSTPGLRDSIVMDRAKTDARTTIERKVSSSAPGAIDSSEVIAKTNADLKSNIDSLKDNKSNQKTAANLATKNVARVRQATEIKSATVDRDGVRRSIDSNAVLREQLNVQRQQRDHLNNISIAMLDYFNTRLKDKGVNKTIKSTRPAPIEITHADGVISTKRQRYI